MVIQCPECQARFKMADEKAKNGVKVRCSRCQHVFPVLLPTAAGEAVAAPAAAPVEKEAPAAEASYTPAAEPGTRETAPDRSSQDEFDGFAFSGAGEAPAASPASAAIDGFDLADFSIDTDTATAGAAAGGNGIDELDLGDFNLDGETPFATGGGGTDNFNPDVERPATEFAFGADEDKSAFDFSEQPATTGFSFDSAASDDDFSFDEAPQGFASEFSGESDPPADDSALSSSAGEGFSFGEFSPESAFAIDPPQMAADASVETAWSAGDGPNDEFEFSASAPAAATEEFDFSNLTFGDEPQAAQPAPPLAPAVSEVLPPLAAAPAPLPIKETVAPAAIPTPPEDDEMFFAPPPPEKKRAFRPAILLLLLLLVAGAGGYFLWQGGMADLSSLISGQTAPPAPAGQIRLTDLNGYFINNADAGQLFVIHGRVVNEFAEARSAIAIKGVLYNQAGQALMQQTVFSGNKIDENALRSLPFAKIEESMNNQFGDSLSNLNVAPGKSLPFTIVFRNLPAGLAEYTAEVTDSKPGAS